MSSGVLDMESPASAAYTSMQGPTGTESKSATLPARETGGNYEIP